MVDDPDMVVQTAGSIEEVDQLGQVIVHPIVVVGTVVVAVVVAKEVVDMVVDRNQLE